MLSSSCNHRHKSRKQWIVAGCAWFIILNSYANALMRTNDDKNDSDEQYTTTTIVGPALYYNDEIHESQKDQDSQLINNYFTRNEHHNNTTATVVHPSESLIVDARVEDVEFQSHQGSSDKVSNGDATDDESSISSRVADVEYLPDGESNSWESTRVESSIKNNAIATNIHSYNIHSDLPVNPNAITQNPSHSIINIMDSIHEPPETAIEISKAKIEVSILENGVTTVLDLEEPSEVLYGNHNPITTAASSMTIQTENSVLMNSSRLNVEVHSQTVDSELADSELETQSGHTPTTYQSTTQLFTQRVPMADYPNNSFQEEFETSDKPTLLVNESDEEMSNNSDYLTSQLVSSLFIIEDTETVPTVEYNTLSTTYISSGFNATKEYIINATMFIEPTRVEEPTLLVVSVRMFKNLTTLTDINSTFDFSHTDEIYSSLNLFNVTKTPTLSSSYQLQDNNISPTVVQLAINVTLQSSFVTPHQFSNVTNNENFRSNLGRHIDFESPLVTKVPNNVVHIDGNVTDNKSDIKDAHVTNRQIIVQQGTDHDDNLPKNLNKPFDNFEKSQMSDIKNLENPRVNKNEFNDSKLNSTAVEQQQIESSASKRYYSTHTEYISPSIKSQSEIFSSSFFTDQEFASSYWIQSSSPTFTIVSVSKVANLEEISSTISPSSSTTDMPSITKLTTVETFKNDKRDPDHQQVLPTVQIPTAYLSLTMRSSWSYFCANQREYQKAFAKHLTVAIKVNVADSQIVFFNTSPCNQVPLYDNTVSENLEGTIALSLYVKDRRGAYSKSLTEHLGQLIMKNKVKGFNDNLELQDVVLNVQLHRKADPVDQHVDPQTTTTHSNEMGIVAAVTISCIAGVCLILLCVLLIILKRRHGIQQQRRCRPVTDAYSLESISIYSSFCKRKNRASKRSYLNQGFDDPNAPTNRFNFAHLAQYSTDENAITEEYKKIPMTMAKLGEMPPGTDVKNRYANVIPFPETRVQLTPNPEIVGSDYINANFVRGFQGKPKHYIASQAPLETTVVDFWQMIWENQCKVILMITNWEENGVPKCAQYFSESITDSHRLFGDYQITTKKIDVRVSFTITYLQIKNLENLMRDVIHFWFTGWPIQGTPNDKVSILEMLLEARSSIKSNSGPTVVHCSPGTGRTGTVLAIDTCMHEFELTRTVDIPRCVYHLRRDRGGLVQTTEQYIFIYEVLNEFACRVMNQSGRSSVRSSIK